MTIQSDPRSHHQSPLSKLAHFLERTGLAMAGALCGLFVSAPLARAEIGLWDSVGFVAGMIIYGFAGFYLGIDTPSRAVRSNPRPDMRSDAVELLSAIGTFLAATAALVSVDVLVFGDTLPPAWKIALSIWWLSGITMQVITGIVARARA